VLAASRFGINHLISQTMSLRLLLLLILILFSLLPISDIDDAIAVWRSQQKVIAVIDVVVVLVGSCRFRNAHWNRNGGVFLAFIV